MMSVSEVKAGNADVRFAVIPCIDERTDLSSRCRETSARTTRPGAGYLSRKLRDLIIPIRRITEGSAQPFCQRTHFGRNAPISGISDIYRGALSLCLNIDQLRGHPRERLVDHESR